MQTHSFKMFVGPMFGGKTTKLLAEIDRLKYKKKNVCLFKPMIDNRYDENAIVSHNGIKHNAISVATGDDILKIVLDVENSLDVIAVDEAFMINDCADALVYMFKRRKSILVSSLDLSASYAPFHEITKMMPYATKIVKCPAICHECEEDAYYTECCIQKNEEILVGGGDIYRPVCFKHYSMLKS